jgi:DNA helicase HerA-like ATPase
VVKSGETMAKLDIGKTSEGKPFTLPIEAVTQTFAILAKRGVGKTYTASVMAEEMLAAGQPIIAIDPTGAWYGLRSEYPVVIFGGEHADVQWLIAPSVIIRGRHLPQCSVS